MFEQVFWTAIAGQINRWRRNILHLDSTSLDKMEPHRIPFLYNFSPHVVPPPLDWPEWIHVAGECRGHISTIRIFRFSAAEKVIGFWTMQMSVPRNGRHHSTSLILSIMHML